MPSKGVVMNRIFLTAMAALMASLGQAYAESYVGVFAGVGFGQTITHGKGNENTNYPDPPDGASPPDNGSLFPGSHITRLDLQNSPMAGAKIGHWFDKLPFIGVEAEAWYNQPNFRRQQVTLSNPGFVGALGAPSFTEDQLRAHAEQVVLALNGMYRYQGWSRLTPYIGGGPALYFWHIHGTGYSGIIPAFGSPGVNGPDVKQNPVTLGTEFKAGVEYAITPQWDVGLEYRLNWSAMKIDKFRSVSSASADYWGHSGALTLTRHF